jgi:hypothetical protein
MIHYHLGTGGFLPVDIGLNLPLNLDLVEDWEGSASLSMKLLKLLICDRFRANVEDIL